MQFPFPVLRSCRAGKRAFTLVELLVVMAIMLVIMGFAGLALTGMKSAGNLTSTAYEISDILEQARAYAMANNTYVFVGFEEVDASVNASKTPQIASGKHPYGRVGIAIVASKDGMPGYDNASSLSNPAWLNYNNGSNLQSVGKLRYFENIHIASEQLSQTGGMARPAITTQEYILGNSSCSSYTSFTWPLGVSAAKAQYNFTKVIVFNPQGVARIQGPSNVGDTVSVVPYMEIGLQQSHGTAVASSSNVAAIQIDAITSTTRIYRP